MIRRFLVWLFGCKHNNRKSGSLLVDEYDSVYGWFKYCRRCGAEFDRIIEVDPATGDDYSVTPTL